MARLLKRTKKHRRHGFALSPSLWTARHIAALRVRYIPFASSGLLDSMDRPLLPPELEHALRNDQVRQNSSLSMDDPEKKYLADIFFASYLLSTCANPRISPGNLVEHLFRYAQSLDGWHPLRWEYGAGKLGPFTFSAGHTIRHRDKVVQWLPIMTGFCTLTGIPKGVVVGKDAEADHKQPMWAEETACLLSMAQMAIAGGQMEWTPIAVSRSATEVAVVTATVTKEYLSGLDALPKKLLKEELVVVAETWDIREKEARVAFAEAVSKILRKNTGVSERRNGTCLNEVLSNEAIGPQPFQVGSIADSTTLHGG